MTKFITACRLVWEWIKKHWKIIVAVLAAILALVGIGSYESTDVSSRIKVIKDAHDEQVRQITQAHIEERIATENAATRLKTTLDTVQQAYDAQNQTLDVAKKQEIAELIQSHDGDQDALLKKIVDATGFPVMVP